MRIFVGTASVIDAVALLRQGFRELGHEADMAMLHSDSVYYESRRDSVCDVRGLYGGTRVAFNEDGSLAAMPPDAFFRLVRPYDMFVFVSSHTLLPYGSDLKILHAMGKKIVCMQLGDEIRHGLTGIPFWHAYGHEFPVSALPRVMYVRRPFWIGDPFFHNLANKTRNMRLAELYATTICTHPSISNLGLRPHMAVQIPMDAGRCRFRIPRRDVPLVIHAPTSTRFKRTDLVLTALEELEAEGVRFVFRRIEKMRNDELLDLLADADVLVDQVACGCLGRLALEGLASGCAVVSGNSSAVPWPPHRPALSVNPANLKDRLRVLLTNPLLRMRLAAEGREYIDQGWHSPAGAAQAILDAVAREEAGDFDYLPTMFADLARAVPDEPMPGALKDMTLEILRKHGMHPEADPARLEKEGFLPEGSSDVPIPRWNLDGFHRTGPWVWCSRRIPAPDFENAYVG